MIQFANPMLLWGLTGLAIPIAIHLLSRKEGRVIRVGSLRHIRETSTRQFKSIKVNEILLLILRCLLIALLVALLSGLSIATLTQDKKWLLVEKGVELDPQFKSMTDSLVADGFEMRFLTIGFPKVGPEQIARPVKDYAALVEQLETKALKSCVVIAYNRASAFKGNRTEISSDIKWIAAEPAADEFMVDAISMKKDSVRVRTGKTSPTGTAFDFRKLSASVKLDSGVTARQPRTISVILATDKNFAHDKELMIAMLRAVDESSPDELAIRQLATSEFSPSVQADALIWLSTLPVPESTTTVTISMREMPGVPVLMREGPGTYLITHHLNQENVVRENMGLTLLNILFAFGQGQNVASAKDQRIADDPVWVEKEAVTSEAAILPVQMNNATTRYIIYALLFVVIMERLVSYFRGQ